METIKNAVRVVHHVWTHPANRSRRASALARAIRFQLRGRLFRRRTLTPIGLRSQIWAELHRTGSSRAVYANPPDLEMAVWQRVLRPRDLFIDVGANVGIYSVIAAECGAEVWAIEPDGECASRVRDNAVLNGYRIRVLEYAIGASVGRAGFTTGLDAENRITSDRSHEVEMRTLDSLLGDRRVRGVKVDVEGFEIEVLKGATIALREKRIDIWQLEWNSASVPALAADRTAVADILIENGYVLYRLHNGALTPLNDYRFGEDVFAFGRADLLEETLSSMRVP